MYTCVEWVYPWKGETLRWWLCFVFFVADAFLGLLLPLLRRAGEEGTPLDAGEAREIIAEGDRAWPPRPLDDLSVPLFGDLPLLFVLESTVPSVAFFLAAFLFFVTLSVAQDPSPLALFRAGDSPPRPSQRRLALFARGLLSIECLVAASMAPLRRLSSSSSSSSAALRAVMVLVGLWYGLSAHGTVGGRLGSRGGKCGPEPHDLTAPLTL